MVDKGRQVDKCKYKGQMRLRISSPLHLLHVVGNAILFQTLSLQESGINLRNIIWSSVLIYLNVATRSFGWSQSNYREGCQVSDWIGLTCYSL